MILRRLPAVLVVLSVGTVTFLSLFHAQAQGPEAAPAAPAPATTRPLAPGELGVLKVLTVGGEGRWDFITIDPVHQRLYVPRSTRVAVIDADSGRVRGEVADTPGVHGVALVEDVNLGFSTNGKENMLL